MKLWWENLSARERLSVRVLVGVAALFFAYQFLASPLARWREEAIRRAEIAETNYRIVAEAASRGSRTAAGMQTGEPVRNALRAAATASDVTLNFINERPDGSVEAQAGAAAPERLFSMFASLEAQYGVRVIAADIARLDDGATEVRAQMTFAR